MELAKREIKLNRQRDTLRAVKGAWKGEDHPELAQGAAPWVRSIRQDSLKRFEKIEHPPGDIDSAQFDYAAEDAILSRLRR